MKHFINDDDSCPTSRTFAGSIPNLINPAKHVVSKVELHRGMKSGGNLIWLRWAEFQRGGVVTVQIKYPCPSCGDNGTAGQ